ncbi:MAG: hypothetical protein ACYC9P_06740 [Rudaea sp.]
MTERTQPVFDRRDVVCLAIAAGAYFFLPDAYASLPNLIGLFIGGWLAAQWLRALVVRS